ncbi:type II toxin-antitoxin system RelE/ParE family toxin [Lacimicrobium alkaliphilum]|uniref:Plasmid stabilization protein n=1 Tax=Lacimicrobium alkaliphilum TaxID=1526571 RepID=A0ABQ1R4Q0_9ALTE|nr:type II toxin-antitoxin system RelE/ParE family toxin [Lacimicrobium alkaliphilum]GGD53892.1 plasmid stabilization protein [Lacimicrobium alkaliphilum]
MSYRIRFTLEAREDIERLYKFLVERDPDTAHRALRIIEQALSFLEEFPFSCRKVEKTNPFLRELIIPFGSAGYVALFEIENQQWVTILAVRHQHEDDYH